MSETTKITKKGKVKFSVYATQDVKNFLEDMAQTEERSMAYITARALQFYMDAMQGKVSGIIVQPVQPTLIISPQNEAIQSISPDIEEVFNTEEVKNTEEIATIEQMKQNQAKSVIPNSLTRPKKTKNK